MPLDDDIEIFVDKNHEYDIADILTGKARDRFEPYTGIGRPNFGYTQSTYWVRFVINNQSSHKKWMLELDTPKINRVHLYKPLSNGAIKGQPPETMIRFPINLFSIGLLCLICR
nr:7TM-DISM domain-containing protein [Lentibacillus sp. JNUCC-1]